MSTIGAVIDSLLAAVLPAAGQPRSDNPVSAGDVIILHDRLRLVESAAHDGVSLVIKSIDVSTGEHACHSVVPFGAVTVVQDRVACAAALLRCEARVCKDNNDKAAMERIILELDDISRALPPIARR